MRAGFFSVEEGMRPADDHWDAAPPELLRDIVGPEGVESPRRDGDQLRMTIKVNRLQLFINERDIPIARGQRCQVAGTQRNHWPAPQPEDCPVRLRAVVRRLDD